MPREYNKEKDRTTVNITRSVLQEIRILSAYRGETIWETLDLVVKAGLKVIPKKKGKK